MVTKTYHGQNMLAALKEVQQELGPDAVVLSMRQVLPGPAWQVWRKPGYEIVAAQPTIENKAISSSKPQNKTNDLRSIHPYEPKAIQTAKGHKKNPITSTQATSEPQVAGLDINLAEKPEIHQLPETNSKNQSETGVKDLVVSTPTPALKPTFPITRAERTISIPHPTLSPLNRIRHKLIDQGLDRDLIERVINVCDATLSPNALRDEKRIEAHVKLQLEVGIKFSSDKPGLGSGKRPICLIGVSGSGKTSTCAKLASDLKTSQGKNVVWVEADTVRTGAISEARVYTESLSIPLKLAYTSEDLSHVITSSLDADQILVDTPGCNPRNEASVVELGNLLASIPQRATYLVVSATQKDSDLAQASSVFGLFDINGLIITKMDETSTFGNVYNLAWRSHFALAYFSTGSQAFDNLRPANAQDLVNTLFDEGLPR